MGSTTIGRYVFTPPPGWTRTNYPDGGVIFGTVVGDEHCSLTIFPPRPSSGDLLHDASGVYEGLWHADPMTHYPFPDPSLVRGTSPLGWDYLVLQKEIGGHVGDNNNGALVFVAHLGREYASIVGVSKRPLVSQCFGELVRDLWPAFFYSLRFKDPTRPVPEQDLAARMVGSWTVATSGVADRYTFARNGRYAGVGAVRHETAVGYNEVLETTQAFFGDGAYALRGNSIVLTKDRDKGHPTPGNFRIEQESKDGRTWTDRVCLLMANIGGEVCYKRDR